MNTKILKDFEKEFDELQKSGTKWVKTLKEKRNQLSEQRRQLIELPEITNNLDKAIEKEVQRRHNRAPAVVSETPAKDLTEEELQTRKDKTNYYTALINNANRQTQQKAKEIEDRIRERADLLDIIRARDREIQKAREKERDLQVKIQKLEEECDRMKKGCDRWDPLLKKRKDELKETKAELKDVQYKNIDLEEELRQQRQTYDEEKTKIAMLTEEKKKLETHSIRLDDDRKKLAENAIQLERDKKRLEENAKQLDDDQNKLEENARKLDEDKKKLGDNAQNLSDGFIKLGENAKKLADDKEKLDINAKQLADDTEKLGENAKKLADDKEKLQLYAKALVNAAKRCCTCGECRSFLTLKYICCCKEWPSLKVKMEGMRCITLHPWFLEHCINKDVLEVGSENEFFYAERATRRFYDWIGKETSSFKSRDIPACVSIAIMEKYSMHSWPSDQERCTLQ